MAFPGFPGLIIGATSYCCHHKGGGIADDDNNAAPGAQGGAARATRASAGPAAQGPDTGKQQPILAVAMQMSVRGCCV